MNIISAISELLMHHPMVVIPNFGGFISRESPASFNKNSGLLKPKSKTCFFNTALSQEDGLLANYMAKSQNIPYSKAIEQISNEIKNINSKLIANKSFAFGNLGNFYLNSEGNTYFTTNSKTNFNKKSFGLEPIVITKTQTTKSIFESNTEQNIQNPVAQTTQPILPTEELNTENTTRKPKVVAFNSLNPINVDRERKLSLGMMTKIAASLLLLVVTGFLFLKTDTFKPKQNNIEEASLLPTDSGESNQNSNNLNEIVTPIKKDEIVKNDRIIEEIESNEEFEENIKKNNVDIDIITEPLIEEKNAETATAKSETELTNNRHCVSMARFINEESANQYVNNYKHLNKIVEILKDPNSPFYHIIVGEFKNKTQANAFALDYQKEALGMAKVFKFEKFNQD